MRSAALLVMVLAARAAEFPAPKVDIRTPAQKQSATVVLAGGCFWGMEAIFKEIQGVADVMPGYAGGDPGSARYEMVAIGHTGHAESIRITFDPSQISYGKLLQVYFSVAHDPTQLNRQGPDEGAQYRSAIFYTSEEQKRVAEAYIEQLKAAKVFRYPIVTQVEPLAGFYPAEEEHQNFLERNPGDPYIVQNDLPKLRNLERQFPTLIRH